MRLCSQIAWVVFPFAFLAKNKKISTKNKILAEKVPRQQHGPASADPTPTPTPRPEARFLAENIRLSFGG